MAGGAGHSLHGVPLKVLHSEDKVYSVTGEECLTAKSLKFNVLLCKVDG